MQLRTKQLKQFKPLKACNSSNATGFISCLNVLHC